MQARPCGVAMWHDHMALHCTMACVGVHVQITRRVLGNAMTFTPIQTDPFSPCTNQCVSGVHVCVCVHVQVTRRVVCGGCQSLYQYMSSVSVCTCRSRGELCVEAVSDCTNAWLVSVCVSVCTCRS